MHIHVSAGGMCVCVSEFSWPSLFPDFLYPQSMVYFHFLPKLSLFATAVVPVVRKQRSTGKNKGKGGRISKESNLIYMVEKEGEERNNERAVG